MISKTILRYFPPPAFLKTPYAGLSMSDAHIRIIQFESGSAGLRIKTYAALPLPQGAITSGRVNNPEQIIGVLKELREKTGISYVRVSIPEEKAYLFETELPEVDPKEIRNAIGFKLEDNVPLPADQIIFDYATVAESLNSVNAIVSALPAKFVQIYVDLFLGAGFVPYVFEIESQAIARALLHPADLDTYLIMHVSLGKIQICIASLRLVHFTSTVNPSRSLS
jgi:type IV pilus assembly protein PilM